MMHNVAYFIFNGFYRFYWIDCNYDIQDMKEKENERTHIDIHIIIAILFYFLPILISIKSECIIFI